MATAQPWYVTERAEVLAKLYLTRRDDLDVIPVTSHRRNPGYDLLVHVQGVALPAAFAVAVKGQRRWRAKASLLHEGTFTVEYSPGHLEDSGVPVCMFLFTVDDDNGYFRWLHKPLVSPDAAELELDPELAQAQPDHHGNIKMTSEFAELNASAVAAIVDQVKAWHEAKARPRMLVQRA